MKHKYVFLICSFSIFILSLFFLNPYSLSYIELAYLVLCFFLIQMIFYSWSLFDFYRFWSFQDYIIPVLLNLLFYLSTAFLLQSWSKTGEFSFIFLFLISYLVLDCFFRVSFKLILKFIPHKSIVFLVESPIALDLVKRLEETNKWNIKAILTHQEDIFPPPSKRIIWRNWEEVHEIIVTLNPDILIYEDPLPLKGFSYFGLPDNLSRFSSIHLSLFVTDHLGIIPVKQVSLMWMQKFFQKPSPIILFVKRFFDLCLVFVLLPFFIFLIPFIALITKLTSQGSIFYFQERVGLNGKLFKLFKFRSMVSSAEKKGVQWAIKGDNRVTSWGKIMRKWRLDELPQIWNVLKGDMSFIGPRPERIEFVQMLKENIPFYDFRHSITPGLTGWAQVNFPYGSSIEDALHKTEYDLYYIRNYSLWLDFKITLKTIQIILMGRGQ